MAESTQKGFTRYIISFPSGQSPDLYLEYERWHKGAFQSINSARKYATGGFIPCTVSLRYLGIYLEQENAKGLHIKWRSSPFI